MRCVYIFKCNGINICTNKKIIKKILYKNYNFFSKKRKRREYSIEHFNYSNVNKTFVKWNISHEDIFHFLTA